MDETSASPDDRRRPHAAYLLGILRRHLFLIVVWALVVGGVAYVYSKLQEQQYSATARLLFRDPQFDQTLFGGQFFTPVTDPSREAATNRDLVALPVVSGLAAKRLGGNVRASDVQGIVQVQSAGASDLVDVTATHPDPERAAVIANAVAQSYIDYRRSADRSKILEALRLVRAQLENGEERSTELTESLRQRAQDLQVLADTQTGNAEVAQKATVPSVPSRPQTRRNVILGVILGLLLGIGTAVLRDRTDRRAREPSDIQSAFEGPLLSVVPFDRALAGNVGPISELSTPAAEALRALRANLRYFNMEEPLKAVVVASPGVGDGKSTISWYLAAAAASSGQRVLLIEADLRRPNLFDRSPFASEWTTRSRGLSMVLSGQVDIADAVLEPSDPDLPYLLPAGVSPPNPTSLIDSRSMTRVLKWAYNEFDFVVVDVPPPLVVADATPLLTAPGAGIVCVARVGERTVDELRSLRGLLDNLDAFVTGVVANGAQVPRSTYYGGYYEPDRAVGSSSR